MDPLYEIRDLTRVYRGGNVRANDGVSFDVQRGEILAVLGPNGAGKTTLVKQMVAHLRPTAGTIRLQGRDVVAHADWVPTVVSYYPQQPLALHHLRVQEALVCTGRLRGLTAGAARVAAERLMAELGLTGVARRVLNTLSGGQQRLAGLGTALIGDLPVLILDEPTNELDPRNRRLVWDLLKARNQRDGSTVIVVTHNVLEAELVVDRVAIIDAGRLLALESVGALKRRVDHRLRVEVSVAPGCSQEAAAFLGRYGVVQPVGETRLRLFVERAAVGLVVDAVAEAAEALGCEEYRLMPPSLEDVYLHLGGREVTVGAG